MTRTTPELLKIVKEKILSLNMKRTYLFVGGMCGVIGTLEFHNKITTEERLKLKIYLKENIPASCKRRTEKSDGYWWPQWEWSYRINWLNNEISKFKNKGKNEKVK